MRRTLCAIARRELELAERHAHGTIEGKLHFQRGTKERVSEGNRWGWGAAGVPTGGAVGGPVGLVIGGILGAALGDGIDPE
jgi:hypothetical protein